MRALLVLLATLAAAAVAGTSPAAPAAPGPVFVLTGGGWGHGVGMSQWGAYGQARAGRTYRRILAHYYTGTELGEAPRRPSTRLRVLVADAVATVAVTSAATFSVEDSTGRAYDLAAGAVTVGPELELPVGPSGAAKQLPGPVLFRPAKGGTLSFGGKGYRGELRVARAGKRLQLVNVVALESYLLGVVPGEMPKDWPLEALKAQAVAARTYAIANLVKGKSFDLYSDWRSQVYYGVSSEAPGTTRAVRETRGEILTFAGAPVQALYFSSSGGRTRSAIDIYGNETPYLVGVDDPWDAASPHYRWEARAFTGSQLAKAFGLPSPVVDVSTTPGRQGRPAQLVLATAAGRVVELRLNDVRARLGLRSPSFALGTLRLLAPEAVGRAGAPVTLRGVARDVADATLERRTTAGKWVTAARPTVAEDGTFTVTLRPKATTVIRLSGGGLPGPSLTVEVAGAAA
jgi:SpoIID/LytB domain protein